MDFTKKYEEYLKWRLEYVQSNNSVKRNFDCHYFKRMDLEELIWFKENFIEKSEFVPNAKQITIETIDEVITDKKEQRRNERIDNLLYKKNKVY